MQSLPKNTQPHTPARFGLASQLGVELDARVREAVEGHRRCEDGTLSSNKELNEKIRKFTDAYDMQRAYARDRYPRGQNAPAAYITYMTTENLNWRHTHPRHT